MDDRLWVAGELGVSPDDLAEVYVAWGPGLRRTAFLLCGDWQAAEDLVQSAFVKVFAARRRVRERVALPAYLRQTLVRTYVDSATRRWRGEIPTELADDAADPGVHDPEDRLVMLGALARLPTRQRACLVLRFYEDCSVEETAAALGCSPGTVKSTTARGLTRLRSSLADLRPRLTPALTKDT